MSGFRAPSYRRFNQNYAKEIERRNPRRFHLSRPSLRTTVEAPLTRVKSTATARQTQSWQQVEGVLRYKRQLQTARPHPLAQRNCGSTAGRAATPWPRQRNQHPWADVCMRNIRGDYIIQAKQRRSGPYKMGERSEMA